MDENMALTPYETREILFYKTDNGDVKVEILLYQENLWLTQAKMAELFEVQKAAISKHLKNIFVSGELMEDSVVSVLETTAADGKNYPTRYYNLDAIIAVGYRVNSKKATMFRIWANRILKEYIIKGYVMDDERLKEPQNFFGKDYFEEQLERIRDIRASERRFYQKITDIYSQCSADYDVDSPVIHSAGVLGTDAHSISAVVSCAHGTGGWNLSGAGRLRDAVMDHLPRSICKAGAGLMPALAFLCRTEGGRGVCVAQTCTGRGQPAKPHPSARRAPRRGANSCADVRFRLVP